MAVHGTMKTMTDAVKQKKQLKQQLSNMLSDSGAGSEGDTVIHEANTTSPFYHQRRRVNTHCQI